MGYLQAGGLGAYEKRQGGVNRHVFNEGMGPRVLTLPEFALETRWGPVYFSFSALRRFFIFFYFFVRFGGKFGLSLFRI